MVSWGIFWLPVIIICVSPLTFWFTFNDCRNYFLWFVCVFPLLLRKRNNDNRNQSIIDGTLYKWLFFFPFSLLLHPQIVIIICLVLWLIYWWFWFDNYLVLSRCLVVYVSTGKWLQTQSFKPKVNNETSTQTQIKHKV